MCVCVCAFESGQVRSGGRTRSNKKRGTSESKRTGESNECRKMAVQLIIIKQCAKTTTSERARGGGRSER